MTQETIPSQKPSMTIGSIIIILAAFINIAALICLAYQSYGLDIWGKTNIALMALCLMNTILFIGQSLKKG